MEVWGPVFIRVGNEKMACNAASCRKYVASKERRLSIKSTGKEKKRYPGKKIILDVVF